MITEIHGSYTPYSLSNDPQTFLSSAEVGICGFEWNVLTNNRWIASKFDANMHVHLRMNCNNSAHILAFNLAPSSGQNFII